MCTTIQSSIGIALIYVVTLKRKTNPISRILKARAVKKATSAMVAMGMNVHIAFDGSAASENSLR